MLDSAYQKAREINDELEELLKDTLMNFERVPVWKRGGFPPQKIFLNLHKKLDKPMEYVMVEQKKSYTFLNQNKMPVYGDSKSKCHVFSRQRIYRGVYKNHVGKRYHADINGALNNHA